MNLKQIIFFDSQVTIACDGRCEKAWGIGDRPSVPLSDDPDDFAYKADDELGRAPRDPGSYEGRDAKPIRPAPGVDPEMNRWCARACERRVTVDGWREVRPDELKDFSRRRYNMPASDPGNATA